MAHKLQFQILKSLGLTETEAIMYELLLELGPQLARDLVKPSGYTRGNVYNVLMQLHEKGFISIRKGKQQLFEAADPSLLRKLLDDQTDRIHRLDDDFTSTLPKLVSRYNLSTNKPAIQTYEGKDGYKAALDDLLSTSRIIRTYIDTDALTGPLVKLDTYFEKRRVALGVKSRVLVSDTPQTRKLFETPLQLQEVQFITDFPVGFKSALEIGEDNVTYFTLTQGKDIAVSIKHPAICEMQKKQFDFLWNYAARANGLVADS